MTIAGNVTLTTSISGTGIVSISSGYTLTVGGNATYSVSTVSGAGTLTIASGYTLTFSGNNILPSSIVINGTLALSNNLSIPTNITLPSGSGTLSIASGYTLTQAGSITLSTSTITKINIQGTLANAGYGITIASGATVNINVTGSVTTASTAGTLTIDGTLYWTQPNLLPTGASSTFPSFPLTLAGKGIMIAGYNFYSGASNTISFSSTAITAGSTDGSGSASGSGYENYYLSAVEGSAVGKYCLAIYDGSSYYQNALIYIGTANTSYSVSTSYHWSNYYDPAIGTTIYAANLSGSAGTITISGGLHV